MSVAGIASLISSITSGTLFAPRRMFDKAANANSIFETGLDVQIATGQAANVAKNTAAVAKASKNTALVAEILEKEKAVKDFFNANEVAKGIGKIGRFTMNNINPLIGATEIVRTIYSDDKQKALIAGTAGFTGMLLFEEAARKFAGIAENKAKNTTPVVGLYRKMPFGRVFINKQADAFRDYCKTAKFMNVSLKHLPSALKGVFFVAMSIGGSMLCHNLAEKLVDVSRGQKAAA